MSIFKVSLVATHTDIINIGSKIFIDEIKADYIKETKTGYALIDNSNGTIVYTVPAGLIVEKVKKNASGELKNVRKR